VSEQPSGHEHEDHVVIQRALLRPLISVQVDPNGIIHLIVGEQDEDGHVDLMEDFIVVPPVAEQMGDGLFKAAQTAKPLYEEFLARIAEQEGEGTPDAPE